MASMNAAKQAEYFRTQLGSSLPPLQVAAFKSDLLRVNLGVMDAALRQAAATAKTAGKPPRDARGAVWVAYNHRIAEINQLFVPFFVFESAWRAIVAEVLKKRYGGTEAWWHPVRAQLNRPDAQLSLLGGVGAPNEVVRRLAHILKRQPADHLAALATSYDLIEASTLGDVEWLIARHWSMVASLFSATARPAPTSADFIALFRRVRCARNDAYHHRIVSDRQRAIEAAEQLLDLLNIHLGQETHKITATSLLPFRFAVARHQRHG